MCNAYCVLFGALNLKKEEIQGRKVIEVGSRDANGSLRPLLESFKPEQYIGVDIIKGRGVDVICKAEDLLNKFQKESFDVLISTELLEHVRDWKRIISNFKNVVKTGGIILLTTRSFGYPFHGSPYDFWRYELEDMKNIFSDCLIEKLEKDPKNGVFVKVRKPIDFAEKKFPYYELYSIVVGKRVKQLNEQDFRDFIRRMNVRKKIREKLRALVPF